MRGWGVDRARKGHGGKQNRSEPRDIDRRRKKKNEDSTCKFIFDFFLPRISISLWRWLHALWIPNNFHYFFSAVEFRCSNARRCGFYLRPENLWASQTFFFCFSFFFGWKLFAFVQGMWMRAWQYLVGCSSGFHSHFVTLNLDVFFVGFSNKEWKGDTR